MSVSMGLKEHDGQLNTALQGELAGVFETLDRLLGLDRVEDVLNDRKPDDHRSHFDGPEQA